MTSFWKIVSGAALVAAIVSLGMQLMPASSPFGAVGGKLIEQYDPYVRYNGGVKSALPMLLTSNLTASSTILSAKKVCFEFYATSTATLLHMNASTTPTLPRGAAAVLTANYGACQ